MWIGLGLLSALCLGLYDVSKKHALRENAVLPVLFAAVIIGALTTLPLVIAGWWWPQAIKDTWLASPMALSVILLVLVLVLGPFRGSSSS